MNIIITYNRANFTARPDADHLDIDATIDAWETRVQEHINHTYPYDTVEFHQEPVEATRIDVEDPPNGEAEEDVRVKVRKWIATATDDESVWVKKI